jgi:hypothetical protein
VYDSEKHKQEDGLEGMKANVAIPVVWLQHQEKNTRYESERIAQRTSDVLLQTG